MKIIRQVLRLMFMVLHILLGVSLTLVLMLLGQTQDKANYRQVKRWWSKTAVRILGLKIQTKGIAPTQPAMLVANHISWLDIFVLGSVMDIRFLSKAEVRKWPVIGWLADRAGTLFIARGQSGAAQQASQHLAQVIRQGDHVLFFPEGTTTDGTSIRRFHARLFAPALEADVPIQPIALFYPDQQGQANQIIPYINDATLLGNLWSIAGEPQLQAKVEFLSLVETKNQARKAIASQCEERIRTCLESKQLVQK